MIMGKLAWSFILFIIPVLFVMGVIRMANQGWEGSFLPSTDELITIFSNFPDVRSYLGDAITTFNNTRYLMETAFSTINDFVSFFVAIGKFFELIGNGFVVIWQILVYVFTVIGYLFTNVLGFGLPVTLS